MATVKVIELIGASTQGWPQAAESALAKATQTIQDIICLDVVGWTAEVKDGKIAEYHANVKVAFRVHD